MRVLQVVWSLERAGAEQMVLSLAKALPSRGIDVEVLALGGGGELEGAFAAAQVPCHVAPPAARANRWALVRYAKRFMEEKNPDLLHTHLGADYWAGLFAHGRRPWMVTLHGRMRDEPAAIRFLRGFAERAADAVACVSDEVRADAISRHRVAEKKARVVRLGLDLARFPFAARRSFRDVPRLVTVGRFVPGKNQATLLRALEEVRRPWTLELAGAGPDERGLRLLAESLGIMPRVRFLGSIENIPGLLSSADLFCFPSLHEGQSLALLEAAASGVPILASDLPVFRETFDETSLAFAPATEERRWTASLREVLARPQEAFARAHVARAVIERTFTLDRMADAYATWYRELLT
jgi:glycosyltransferase involved in cell wall biosynthesis